MIVLWLFWIPLSAVALQELGELRFTGVYQGKILFIQNPYDPETGQFCVTALSVNGYPKPVPQLSAIKIDFQGVEPFTPVSIQIVYRAGCEPVVINPDAIRFHSLFTFQMIEFTDSTLVWETKGEQKGTTYIMEQYVNGFWEEVEQISAMGSFERAAYERQPLLEEGANKFRVKYVFPDETYLYSEEVDFHFYPDPVTFSPAEPSHSLTLSRTAFYQIYNAKSKLVLSGQGIEIDVSALPPGQYVVYFDGRDPGVFNKK